MAPTAPPWPAAGMTGRNLNLNLTNAMMMDVCGAEAATVPPPREGGGPRPQPLATAGAATAAALGTRAHFRLGFPETMNVQGARGEFLMGGAGMAGLTLLGQVAHLSPNAARAGGHVGAAALAGLGDATEGPAPTGGSGIYSNAGGEVHQAIAGAGDGFQPPGAGPAAAAATAAGYQLPHNHPAAPPRGPAVLPAGGAPVTVPQGTGPVQQPL